MATKSLGRREFLKQSATAAGAAVAASGAAKARAAAPKGKRPSVVLLIADDHGREDMGCWGNNKVRTPNIDKLAENGVRFTQAYCTTASCSASRSVILTGLYNHANGQYGHAHSFHHFVTLPWVEPFPALLRKAGYKTGVVGKLHVNPEEQYGFDYQPSVGTRNVKQMADAARKFVEDCDGAPFYLHVGYSDPHRDWPSANKPDYPGVKRTEYSPDDVKVPSFLPDYPEVREELANYYEAVGRLDQGVGMIMKMLEETGRADDTIVMYISDNGIPFPGAKTTVYDPGIHMPMIVSSPFHKKRGGVNNAMTNYTDLAPTILEWAGVDPPKAYELQGRSWANILDEENPEGWDEIYFSHTFHEITMYYPSRGIRTRRYKYIHNLYPEVPFPHASDLLASKTWQAVLKRGDGKYGPRTVDAYLHRPLEELYDLENDPDEVKNLVDDPKHKKVLDELRRKTVAFRRRTKDGWMNVHNMPSKPLPGT